MTYMFRRADNDEVIEVDFATMMNQDAAGYISLEDGVQARRCLHLEAERDGRQEKSGAASTVERPIISDALGFPIQQLEEFEADRKAHDLRGVEFILDPTCEWFVQAKFDSPQAKERYRKHRNTNGQFEDLNSRNGSGASLSEYDLEKAKQLIEERYGK